MSTFDDTLRGRPLRPRAVERKPRDHVGGLSVHRKYCEAYKCPTPTKGGKDRCVRHIKEMPYVQQLLSDLQEMNAADARVSELGVRFAKVASITAQEIIGQIKFAGRLTIPRIARILHINTVVITRYCEMLEKKGIVDTEENRRGMKIVFLTEKGKK